MASTVMTSTSAVRTVLDNSSVIGGYQPSVQRIVQPSLNSGDPAGFVQHGLRYRPKHDTIDEDDEAEALEKMPAAVWTERRFWLGEDFGWHPGLLETGIFQTVTMLFIVANSAVIGYQTDRPKEEHWGKIENLFLAAFSTELVIRLAVLGPRLFFKLRDNVDLWWNVFDFILVSLGIMNALLVELELIEEEEQVIGKHAALFRVLRILRILRVLRVIRIVRFLKQLYLLAYGFAEGTLAVFWVAVLASLGCFVSSVFLVRTYGRVDAHELLPTGVAEDDFDLHFFERHFGHMILAMFSLFELICAPDLHPYKTVMFQFPLLSTFLVVFVILGSFGINGMLVALINESILEKNMARLEADRIEREHKRKVLKLRCQELFDSRDLQRNRVLPREQLITCKDQIAKLFESLGVNYRDHDLDQMFYVMDYDDTGMIERSEFIQGLVELCDQIRPMSIMELHYQISKTTSTVADSDAKLDVIDQQIDEVAMLRQNECERSRELIAEVRSLVSATQGDEAPEPGQRTSGVTFQAETTYLMRSHMLPGAPRHGARHPSATGCPADPLRSSLARCRAAFVRDDAMIDKFLQSSAEPSAEDLRSLANSLSRMHGTVTEGVAALFDQAHAGASSANAPVRRSCSNDNMSAPSSYRSSVDRSQADLND